MQWDGTADLYYDHAREYDQGLGRFGGVDPMGFDAGDTDLYGYVGDGATDGVDTSGLDEDQYGGGIFNPANWVYWPARWITETATNLLSAGPNFEENYRLHQQQVSGPIDDIISQPNLRAGSMLNGGNVLTPEMAKTGQSTVELGAAATTPIRPAIVPVGVVKVINIDPAKYPESAANLNAARATNRPLAVNRSGAAANRRTALAGVPKVPAKHLDEAPPALLRQPGDVVRVTPIQPGDNTGSGAVLGNGLRGVNEGQHVILTTEPQTPPLKTGNPQ